MSNMSYTNKGRRIELIYTNDPFTHLKRGDQGTVQYEFLNLNEWVLQVKWDSGSNLGLIIGKDTFRYLDQEETKWL